MRAKRLGELETIIERGQQVFIEVGNALLEIREKDLFPQDSFELYCQERWGWNRAHGHRLADAAEVINGLPKALASTVTTERAARELGKMSQPQQVEVLRELKASGTPVTSSSVAQNAPVSNRRSSPMGDGKSVDTKTETQPVPAAQLDAQGFQIPEHILPLWNRAEEMGAELIRHISPIRAIIRKASEEDDVVTVEMPRQQMTEHLDMIYFHAKTAKPHAVCYVCDGKKTKIADCDYCKGRGFISEDRLKGISKQAQEKRRLSLKS